MASPDRDDPEENGSSKRLEYTTANIAQDAGVVDANDKNAFITAAKTRQWGRENSV